MYHPCKELFESAQSAVNSTDLGGVNWDQWITQGQSQGMEGSAWSFGYDDMGYSGQLLDVVPGDDISGGFAFAVERSFQESTST